MLTERELEKWQHDRAAKHRTATPFHEAAHVVAAYHFNLTFDTVTLVPKYTTLGHAVVRYLFTDDELSECWWRAIEGRPLSGPVRHEVETQIIMAMAGDVAEDRALGEGLAQLPEPPADPAEREREQREADQARVHLEKAAREAGESTTDDKQYVDSLLKQVTANEHEAESYEAWLLERTRTLVRTEGFWRACIALANALLEKITLSGSEAKEVIEGSLAPRPSTKLPDDILESTSTKTWRTEECPSPARKIKPRVGETG